jgi:hypothetical protein
MRADGKLLLARPARLAAAAKAGNFRRGLRSDWRPLNWVELSSPKGPLVNAFAVVFLWRRAKPCLSIGIACAMPNRGGAERDRASLDPQQLTLSSSPVPCGDPSRHFVTDEIPSPSRLGFVTSDSRSSHVPAHSATQQAHRPRNPHTRRAICAQGHATRRFTSTNAAEPAFRSSRGHLLPPGTSEQFVETFRSHRALLYRAIRRASPPYSYPIDLKHSCSRIFLQKITLHSAIMETCRV